jgi:UDPglucose 6-dehydrogenase
MLTPRVSIVGTGYVGLCTAVGFASKGYNVITSTHNHKKAEKINCGLPPFFEPDLQPILEEAIKSRKLKCVTNRRDAISDTDVTFIAVGTPSQPDGSIDLQYIRESSHEIGEALKEKIAYHLIIVKSTVVPGTTENVVKPILEESSEKQCGIGFGLCMSPEFLRQGAAIFDTLNPDRIVIGEYDTKSGDILEDLSTAFYDNNTPTIIRTRISTAELIKYSNNAFLATKISFINTIANLCQKIPNSDIVTIAKAIGLDKRINPQFLNAGIGYGGSCFPKDVKALIAYSKTIGYNPLLLNSVEEVNNNQPKQAIALAKQHLGNLHDKRIAILGLSFKPNTSDMREARSIPIINQLLTEGAQVIAYDPVAIPNAKSLLSKEITYASSPIECLKDAHCAILVTEWDEFKKLTPEDFQSMHQPILIDSRRIFNPEDFAGKVKLEGIGLGKPKANNKELK